MRRLGLTLVLLTLALVLTDGITSDCLGQKKSSARKPRTLKLEYGNKELAKYYGSPSAAPIPVSPSRLLVTVGDTLYMLGRNGRVLWKHSEEPNTILDVSVGPNGLIYVGVFDGVFRVLSRSGKEIWSHFMSGSANYSQIRSYKSGLLVVIDMEGYREKHPPAAPPEDIQDQLEFWNNKKMVWQKEFPRGARLQVLGNRILAISQTKEGAEIREIR